MTETRNPGQDPGTRLALLEERLRALETGQQKESEFRESYYADQRIRIRHDAELEVKISAMDEKLDKLVEWQETQREKPGKRWETLAEKSLWTAAAAVTAFLLGRLGL